MIVYLGTIQTSCSEESEYVGGGEGQKRCWAKVRAPEEMLERMRSIDIVRKYLDKAIVV